MNRNGSQPHTIHADCGGAMVSEPVSELLVDLGVIRSYSRPRTSNDNPYSEAQFKNLKYMHDFPERFGSLEDARVFCDGFFMAASRRTVTTSSPTLISTPHVGPGPRALSASPRPCPAMPPSFSGTRGPSERQRDHEKGVGDEQSCSIRKVACSWCRSASRPSGPARGRSTSRPRTAPAGRSVQR